MLPPLDQKQLQDSYVNQAVIEIFLSLYMSMPVQQHSIIHAMHKQAAFAKSTKAHAENAMATLQEMLCKNETILYHEGLARVAWAS